MTAIKTHCDHCGKELKNNSDCNDIEISFSLGGAHYGDLCRECEQKLEEIVIDFIARQRVAEYNAQKKESNDVIQIQNDRRHLS